MRRASGGLLLGLLLVAASCRQVLDIQDASLDPTPSTPAGSGSAPQASGSTGGGSGSAAPGAGNAGSDSGGAAGTDGQATATGGDSAAGAAGGPAEPPTLCESYCDAVDENCSGSLAIYTSREMCLAVCAVMPQGFPGDDELGVNSVQCRLAAAQAAGVSEPEYSCAIAAPGGNGGCGTNCENLCRLRSTICSEWLSGDDAACLTACAKLPDLGTYTTNPSAMPSNTRGGHVQCRLYHVSAAATDEPETHCLHADGASPCIER